MAIPEEDDEHNVQPDTAVSTPNSSNAHHTTSKTTHAPKDRSCPFCGQAFTSSSLGRHLDLYIRPKNPKPPDGVHDVDEIRKLRGGITRRQPRTSGKANNSGSVSGANARSVQHEESIRQEDHGNGVEDESATHSVRMGQDTPINSPINAKETTEPALINKANWHATGVINNLPPRAPSRGASEHPQPPPGQVQRLREMRRDAGGSRIPRPEYDGMWKLQEAAEMGRAAEMALREVLGSLEAAAKKTEPKVLYDEFDFFSLSFPGLCLAILPAPSTLHSASPFPSAESWTIAPPGRRQYDTLVRFLNLKFNERQTYDPLPDSTAFKHHTHLSGAWEHWEALPEAERASIWQLEILRAFARGQDRNQVLQSKLDRLQQHADHLEAEFDRLSRCQLPREYLTHPPNTMPIKSAVMREMKKARPSDSAAAEVDYDVEALISKWRSTIRATVRASRVPQPSQAPPPQTIYKDVANSNQLRDDMLMTGAVVGIGGPMPRGLDSVDPQYGDGSGVSYETPPTPGAVVGIANDEATPQDADADGEMEEMEADVKPEEPGILAKPRLLDEESHSPLNRNAHGISDPHLVNVNGKRPLKARSGLRVLKEAKR